MAGPNVRDQQVIREAVISGNPNARDFQVMREAVINITANVRDLQVFREAIILRGGTTGTAAAAQTFVNL